MVCKSNELKIVLLFTVFIFQLFFFDIVRQKLYSTD